MQDLQYRLVNPFWPLLYIKPFSCHVVVMSSLGTYCVVTGLDQNSLMTNVYCRPPHSQGKVHRCPVCLCWSPKLPLAGPSPPHPTIPPTLAPPLPIKPHSTQSHHILPHSPQPSRKMHVSPYSAVSSHAAPTPTTFPACTALPHHAMQYLLFLLSFLIYCALCCPPPRVCHTP